MRAVLRGALLSLLLVASAQAQTAVVAVDTPTTRYHFRGCALNEAHFQQFGRVATVIAECVGKSTQAPQVAGWQPPDLSGWPFPYQGRIRVSQTIEPWLECEVATYSSSPGGYGFVQVACLTDNFTGAR